MRASHLFLTGQGLCGQAEEPHGITSAEEVGGWTNAKVNGGALVGLGCCAFGNDWCYYACCERLREHCIAMNVQGGVFGCVVLGLHCLDGVGSSIER